MHVTHIISGLDPRAGGPPTALVGLTEALIDAGVEVTVVSTWRESDNLMLGDRLRDKGVDIRLVGPARGPLLRHPQLASTVTKAVGATDLVHIHALWEEIHHLAARTAYQKKVPYIIRPCGMLDPWSLRQKRLKKSIYMKWRLRGNLNRAHAIHFTSNTERDLTIPLKLNPLSIVESNGISLSEFEDLPERGRFRSGYPQIGDRPMVLFLSRLHYKKGLDLLIPGFAKVTDKDTVLVLAGPDSGGHQAQIESQARELGISDRVIFTGMLYGEERIASYVDADLFVLPSYQENFGIVVVEALAAGTPVVISDQVNIHDQITAAGVGAVVKTQVDALGEALNRWLSDSTLRDEAAARARPFVWDHYNWDAIAQRWVANYENILKRNQ